MGDKVAMGGKSKPPVRPSSDLQLSQEEWRELAAVSVVALRSLIANVERVGAELVAPSGQIEEWV